MICPGQEEVQWFLLSHKHKNKPRQQKRHSVTFCWSVSCKNKLTTYNLKHRDMWFTDKMKRRNELHIYYSLYSEFPLLTVQSHCIHTLLCVITTFDHMA